MTDATKSITIAYFALLREERGRAEEIVETGAATARELYEELKQRHGFTLSAETLKVAVNDAFARWEAELNDRDAVVFIPPVSGG